MNISWKLKSRLFALVDFFRVDPLLYFLQRHVTGRSRINSLSINDAWKAHKEALEAHGCTGFIFEFGAGKSLAQNLFLSTLVDRQLVVDLKPMLEIRLADQARSLISGLRSNVSIKRRDDLLDYGISYRAPCDATQLDLPDESVDACVSTNSLEHIPAKSISDLLTELKRVLKDSGVISAFIDYTDHYAHTDSKISLLNFLQFSDSEWKRHNHVCHFQNRLRHSDYKLLFEESGFEVVGERVRFRAHKAPEKIDSRFDQESPDLMATSGHFVLKKRS